jgi:hypothetical protein
MKKISLFIFAIILNGQVMADSSKTVCTAFCVEDRQVLLNMIASGPSEAIAMGKLKDQCKNVGGYLQRALRININEDGHTSFGADVLENTPNSCTKI